MAGSNTRFLCQKLVCLIQAVSVYLRSIFSFISTYIFRLDGDGSGSLKKKVNEINVLETESELLPVDKSQKEGTELIRDKEDEKEEEEEEEGVYLKFKFQTYEEFSRIQKGAGDIFNSQVVLSGRNDFTSGKSFITTFIDELETFPVKEEINATDVVIDEQVFDDEIENREIKEVLVFDTEENEPQLGGVVDEEEEKGNIEGNRDFSDEYRIFSEKNSVITDSDCESVSFVHDGFLFDGDFEGELDEKTESESELLSDSDNFDEEDSDIMEELKKLEEHNLENPDFLRDRDFNEDLANTNDDESEKTRSDDSSVSESDDSNKLESLWEHQELIEQLRMELKKVRATGLPTIQEDSESSPKMMDNLKPWKIDEFQRESYCVGELHKFYKSYRERMRKFDIINYQKMYAMGFLQLKDHAIPKQKAPPPSLKSLVSQNIWLFKHKINGSNPMKKFIMELQGDLEAVYVGQMCLSWEFLHWQYDKALQLWDSDPRGSRMYNEVAGEFQQLQVLMQRFIEDEPFQGPRVQYYVKTRCAVRNLLQIPVIREDKKKEKRKKEMDDEYVITSDVLVEIVEESIRIFWRFVQADKDCSAPPINGRHKKLSCIPIIEEDSKLLVEVKRILQKKERKLKELLRCDNCVLRKLRRCREEDDSHSDQVLHFFSQVDMKLVCRVLNMSKITRDQLIWCLNKLDRISFVNRKLRMEPAFLLFPC
ncbi:hypothetical protein ABFS82_08G023000 [Erythranthe guttata]|nr:PREDICTED: uncharacterized protein LOC105961664 isoform X2 [Erythranthe guttata]|eukprot:XP_012841359.1 PREDICTED: uncharacterized protein LOC105961664 isoform X2 [Erythranthe guttata]